MTYIPQGESLTIGGRTITGANLTNLIVLVASTTSNTNRYATPRTLTGTSGYTPSGATKFRVLAVHALSNGATAIGYLAGSCNADVGMSTSTAPSSPVYTGGSVNVTPFVTTAGIGASNQEIVFPWEIPNGKFGFIDAQGTNSSGTVFIYGIEV